MKNITHIAFVLLTSLGLNHAVAQINPLGAMYFQNQYLGNPAYAGIDSGINVGLGYRTQWSALPGSPRNQAATGEYRTGKVGLGLNFYSDKAGLISRTRTVATYAYHLPVGAENQQLHFGLSLGFFNERIYDQDVVGTGNDAAIAALNRRETLVDGDFGFAYTTGKMTIQGALPNMKGFFQEDERGAAGRATFFSAVSYKLKFGQGQDAVMVEPKFSYRGIHGFGNLWDLGTGVNLADNKVSVFGMFHSTGSATVGLGMNFKSRLSFQGIYTTETTALRGNTNGNFELNIKARVF